MKIKLILILLSCTFQSICFSQEQPIQLERLLVDKSEFEKLIVTGNDSIKIEAIKYLIGKRGDTMINLTWHGYTNAEVQEDYNARISTKHPKFSYATNQLVALYLITAIYYSDSQFCSKVEVTYVDKKGETKETTNLKGRYTSKKLRKKRNQFLNMKFKITDEKIVDQLFGHYEKWFLELQLVGFEDVVPPLPINGIQWTR